MKVLHLNNERTWRGGERQTLLTAAEQIRQGIECVLACRPGSRLEALARAENIPTSVLPGTALTALLRLRRLAGSFDVLHCHTGRTHSLATLASIGRPKPIVVSRRVDFVPSASAFNHWKFRNVQKVVCVSRWIATVLEKWGLAAEKMTVIYEAVPGDTYLAREAALKELRQRTEIAAGRPLVGNIAALVGHKDQATLLRAAKVVKEKRPDVTFVIIGEGELKDRLLAQRDQLGVSDTVHFTGFIPQAQRLLPAFDVFAMSSNMEGLGTIVLDAALAGVPIATTAGGGLPEAVLDQKTGLVVPIEDGVGLAGAILRLLEDSHYAKQLAEAAQLRIRADFSVPAMARKYAAVYEQILQPRSAA